MSHSSREFAFLIPLSVEHTALASMALDVIQKHGQLEKTEDSLISYGAALAGAPPVEENPERTRVVMAVLRAMWRHSETEIDLTMGSLNWEPVFPPKGEEPKSYTGLEMHSTVGEWASRNVAVAIIDACQEELDAPAVGFDFHDNLDGEKNAGAVYVVPGEPVHSVDLGYWLHAREKEHEASLKAPPPAADADPGPA